jgi:hypothetical protein
MNEMIGLSKHRLACHQLMASASASSLLGSGAQQLLASPARSCDDVLGKHRITFVGNNPSRCQEVLDSPQGEIDTLSFLVDIGDSG